MRGEEGGAKMSDDTISRRTAIDVLHGYFDGVLETDTICPKDIYNLFEIIPSAQSEQTDCEYCHEDSDGCVLSIEKNSHAWLVRRGRTMKLRVGFKGEYRECDILFCPMCGRRLTDE